MQKRKVYFIFLLLFFTLFWDSFAQQKIVVTKVKTEPLIDGSGKDSVWNGTKGIVTYDKVAKINIVLKAVYTGEKIFFLVNFPDGDESRKHKTWVWSEAEKLYLVGDEREDVFVFKWNMEDNPVDLSIYADNNYYADIWFWKACRTDPAGYADDKFDILSFKGMEKATPLTSKKGKTIYLFRGEDEGLPAYNFIIPAEFKGNLLPRFIPAIPTDSRADIKAKGIWQNREWTIEFGRLLMTGNKDDVQFDIKKSYQFGVSRYEIAGEAVNPKLTQPLYGSGDVSEELILNFEK